MVLVDTQTMRSAIVHFAAVDGDVHRMGGGRGSDYGSGRRWGSEDRLVGSMKTGVASGEFANALLVAKFEGRLEEGKSTSVSGPETKFLGGGGKQAGFLKHCKG